MRDEVILSLGDLLDDLMLDMLVLLTVLKQNVSLRGVLVHGYKTKVVFFSKALVKLFHVLKRLVPVHNRVELRVNDEDDGSAVNVMMAQILVD